MRSFENFLQDEALRLPFFNKEQPKKEIPDRLDKVIAHQKMMQDQPKKLQSLSKPSLSQEPSPFTPSMNDKELVAHAWNAASSNENPFPKDHPNHVKWHHAFMDANMQN